MVSLNTELKSALFSLQNDTLEFEKIALEIFRYQYHYNAVYNNYVEYLGRNINKIDRIEKIPFLPIGLFKSHSIIANNLTVSRVFESSGTTGAITSRHLVADLPLYEAHSKRIFELQYGHLTDYHLFALLPSYLERNNSSLVYMVQSFLNSSYSEFGGFFLDDYQLLYAQLHKALIENQRKIILLGVSFALLDLSENKNFKDLFEKYPDRIIVMETGGMKGRRKEMIREELHEILCKSFNVNSIHSEYGMTELLSQAYSDGQGVFNLPFSMKILLREINDPFSYLPHFKIGEQKEFKNKTGGINVIDLANVDSCSFIETQDLGQYTDDYKGVRIMGRFDNSDVRGCNLMV